MDPLLLTFLRASVAGLLAIALLVGFRQKRPRLAQLVSRSSHLIRGGARLSATHGTGLQRITSTFAVFIGLLPLMTALFGVLRGGERPPAGFLDLFAAGRPLLSGGIRPDAKCGGLTRRRSADAGGVVIVCGLGYAERAKRRGSSAAGGVILGAGDCPAVDAPRLAAGSARILACHLGLLLGGARLCVAGSMLIGLSFWYKGWPRAGSPPSASSTIAAVLRTRPVGGAVARTVSPLMLAVTLGVVLCVVGSRKFGLPPAGWRRERGQQLT